MDVLIYVSQLIALSLLKTHSNSQIDLVEMAEAITALIASLWEPEFEIQCGRVNCNLEG